MTDTMVQVHIHFAGSALNVLMSKEMAEDLLIGYRSWDGSPQLMGEFAFWRMNTSRAEEALHLRYAQVVAITVDWSDARDRGKAKSVSLRS
jgi:hypothetical protein